MANNSQLLESFTFIHPCACLIAGPSQSGKTTIIKQILFDSKIIQPSPTKIIYCFSIWQTAYDEIIQHFTKLYKNIEFFKGLPEIEKFDRNENNLLILDDLMLECANDKNILNIFTRDSHHLNISVFILSQNIFPKEKYARSISLNCQYMILTNSPRDRRQIEVLARQIMPTGSNFILEAYVDAISTINYGYILLDLHQKTNDINRVQTGVFINEERIIYRKIEK